LTPCGIPLDPDHYKKAKENEWTMRIKGIMLIHYADDRCGWNI